MIKTDEPWIPWEMIRPSFKDNSGRRIEDGFLCEDYIVTRWWGDNPPPDSFVIGRGAIVADKVALAHAEQDAKLLTKPPYAFDDVEPTVKDVLSLLNGKVDYRILHFVCHGRIDNENHDLSGLILADGELRIHDISGERQNFGMSKPLVFLNACSSSHAGVSLVGIGGWAERFISANVSGFLGATWNVDDELASRFAEAFYKELWDNKTIGEAVSQAREGNLEC